VPVLEGDEAREGSTQEEGHLERAVRRVDAEERGQGEQQDEHDDGEQPVEQTRRSRCMVALRVGVLGVGSGSGPVRGASEPAMATTPWVLGPATTVSAVPASVITPLR
jgi:hypothetical protein